MIPFGQAGKGTTFEDVSIPLLRSQATLKASLGMGKLTVGSDSLIHGCNKNHPKSIWHSSKKYRTGPSDRTLEKNLLIALAIYLEGPLVRSDSALYAIVDDNSFFDLVTWGWS